MAISLGSGLLAATLLLGQGQEAPAQAPPRPSIFGGFGQPSTQHSRPLFPWMSREDRPIMHKLQSWFGRKDSQEPPMTRPVLPAPVSRPPTRIEATPTSNPSGPLVIPTTPTPLEYPKRLPNAVSQNNTPQQPPVGSPLESATPVLQTTLEIPGGVKSPILPQLADKIGRDDRFEWITGQLEVEAGGYFLYYATPDTVDTYDGRVSLHPQQLDMSSYRRGDLVSVRGELSQRLTPEGRSPVYRASDIQLLERVR